MKKPRSISIWTGFALAVLSLSLTSGCGKLDSGAFAEPTVRIKRGESVVIKEPGPIETPNAAAGEPGTFSGRVIFKGAAPSAKVMYAQGKAPKESDVCSASGAIIDESLVVGADNGDGKRGIANVFIYLDKAPAGFKPTPVTETIAFDQKNCTFLTHALICRVGQPIQIINDDDVPHNTKNAPIENDPVSPTIGRKDRVGSTMVYKNPEKNPVGVKCDFHAWMSAYHLPLNHPFGAVTDKDGNFKIENLPPGNYEFKVWHEKGDAGKGGGFLERKYKVSVKAGMMPVEIFEDASKFGL